MKEIKVNDDTYRRAEEIASVRNITISDLVEELVDLVTGDRDPVTSDLDAPSLSRWIKDETQMRSSGRGFQLRHRQNVSRRQRRNLLKQSLAKSGNKGFWSIEDIVSLLDKVI